MSGAHTLSETERQVENKLSGMTLDFDSMAAISNIFRAANATRNYLERTVLGPHELSWTRVIAEEGGFSKATLTGVLQTLEGKGYLKRDPGTGDKRLVIVTLTPKGRALMKKLFPDFNTHEQQVLSGFSKAEKRELTVALRKITAFTEAQD